MLVSVVAFRPRWYDLQVVFKGMCVLLDHFIREHSPLDVWLRCPRCVLQQAVFCGVACTAPAAVTNARNIR